MERDVTGVDAYFMGLALDEARAAAAAGEVPIGAVVVYTPQPHDPGSMGNGAPHDPGSPVRASHDPGSLGFNGTQNDPGSYGNPAQYDPGSLGHALHDPGSFGAQCDPGSLVVGRGHNVREMLRDPSGHAEMVALRQAARTLDAWRLSGCTVYVTLEPCAMCAGLMVQARVDRCVWGAADPKGGALGTLYELNADERLNHRFPVTGGVRADECAELLREFFAARRRKARSS